MNNFANIVIIIGSDSYLIEGDNQFSWITTGPVPREGDYIEYNKDGELCKVNKVVWTMIPKKEMKITLYCI